MRKVFICSPYRASNPDPVGRAREIQNNLDLAREGCRIAVERGYVPIAPHLFFPQFLCEETERDIGIQMGLGLLDECDELWMLGRRVTDGMAKEISYAKEHNIPIIERLM